MHNPHFPRCRPLALSLLLACGAGASLPAMAGVTCALYDGDPATEDDGGADTGTEDDRTTACGNGAVAGLVATALGTNAEATGRGSLALGYDLHATGSATIAQGARGPARSRRPVGGQKVRRARKVRKAPKVPPARTAAVRLWWAAANRA